MTRSNLDKSSQLDRLCGQRVHFKNRSSLPSRNPLQRVHCSFHPQPIEIRKRAARLPANYHLDVIPNAGHVLDYDQPEAVSARIVEFISVGTAILLP